MRTGPQCEICDIKKHQSFKWVTVNIYFPNFQPFSLSVQLKGGTQRGYFTLFHLDVRLHHLLCKDLREQCPGGIITFSVHMETKSLTDSALVSGFSQTVLTVQYDDLVERPFAELRRPAGQHGRRGHEEVSTWSSPQVRGCHRRVAA